jgi:hypothetical protein
MALPTSLVSLVFFCMVTYEAHKTAASAAAAKGQIIIEVGVLHVFICIGRPRLYVSSVSGTLSA